MEPWDGTSISLKSTTRCRPNVDQLSKMMLQCPTTERRYCSQFYSAGKGQCCLASFQGQDFMQLAITSAGWAATQNRVDRRQRCMGWICLAQAASALLLPCLRNSHLVDSRYFIPCICSYFSQSLHASSRLPCLHKPSRRRPVNGLRLEQTDPCLCQQVTEIESNVRWIKYPLLRNVGPATL